MKLRQFDYYPDHIKEKFEALQHETDITQSDMWFNLSSCLYPDKKPSLIEISSEDDSSIYLTLLFYKSAKRVKFLSFNIDVHYLEWNTGPIIYSDDELKVLASIHMLLDYVMKICVKEKIYFIKSFSLVQSSSWINNKDLDELIRSFGFQSKQWATSFVRLDKCEDALLKSFSSTAQKAIRKANTQSIFVEVISNYHDYIELFYRTYNAENNGQVSQSTFDCMWNSDVERHYRFLIAKNNSGEVVGTLGFYYTGKVSVEIASCITSEGKSQKLLVQDILHWEAYQMSKNIGCTMFNLAGFSPSPENTKEKGIRRFKEKWNGVYIEYPVYMKMPKLLRAIKIVYERICLFINNIKKQLIVKFDLNI